MMHINHEWEPRSCFCAVHTVKGMVKRISVMFVAIVMTTATMMPTIITSRFGL